MADLKTLCIDSGCMNVPSGSNYTAGSNIDITNKVISLKTSTVSGNVAAWNVTNNVDDFRTLYTVEQKGILIGRVYANWSNASGGWRQVYPARVRSGTVDTLPGLKVDEPTNSTTHLIAPFIIDVQPGDTIRGYVRQTSGASLRLEFLSFIGVILAN